MGGGSITPPRLYLGVSGFKERELLPLSGRAIALSVGPVLGSSLPFVFV